MLYMLFCVWVAVSVWEGVEGWGLSDSGGWLPLPTLRHLFLMYVINFERLLLLKKFRYRIQFGPISKKLVYSLKRAQVEVSSSFCLEDIPYFF